MLNTPLHTVRVLIHCLCLPQIKAGSGQTIVKVGSRDFRGTKQRGTSQVYKELFVGARLSVLLATNFVIPASLS